MDVNRSPVCGTMYTGRGHAQLEEIMSAMNIPTVSAKTFRKYHDDMCEGYEATTLNEIMLAAKEEARLAVAVGDVDRNGVTIKTVIADASGSKHSHRTNYSALS
ncbi:hypothetical protein PR048_023642 [Dryococelus australis]|uniref:Mutator-like transposase domain-containing protein n=1 Tax=Dryococelus australis TaxID=614101 RepID=A0ABQ9GUM2_9NEOP|nr:hypothetical protein PR048_023642 [Dryococelus australis]